MTEIPKKIDALKMAISQRRKDRISKPRLVGAGKKDFINTAIEPLNINKVKEDF